MLSPICRALLRVGLARSKKHTKRTTCERRFLFHSHLGLEERLSNVAFAAQPARSDLLPTAPSRAYMPLGRCSKGENGLHLRKNTCPSFACPLMPVWNPQVLRCYWWVCLGLSYISMDVPHARQSGTWALTFLFLLYFIFFIFLYF